MIYESIKTLQESLFCLECKGRLIQNGHESVCEKCGLVYNDELFICNYQFNEIKDTDYNNPDQFVSIGKVIDNVCTLGTHIGYFNSKSFCDYKGSLIPPKNQKTYAKLKRFYSLPLKIKNHETDYRILKILNDICHFIQLSPAVKNRSAYFYQKIKKNSPYIKNHVTLIAFCIFQSLREFSNKAPVGIRELAMIFQQMGHRISPRLIIRDSLDYQHIIKNSLTPHKSEDYITRLANSIINYPPIALRMEKKNSDWNKEEYQIKLIEGCNRILNILNKKIRGSRNPYILAGAIVYGSDKLIAKENNKKSILTQNIASNAMEIPEYSIRDHYVKIIKPILF